MNKSRIAFGVLANFVLFATPASATIITFTGVSQTVQNPDTGENETYAVTLKFDGDVAPIIRDETTFNAPYVNYQTGYYLNLVSASIAGPRYDMTLTNGFSRVSTLDSSRFRDGTSGFFAAAGSDSTTIGYSIGFIYFAQTAFASTAFPTALDISAALENGLNLTEYYYDGDPLDEIITSRELLNFRFASGGLVPAAAAVPEPATWAMMIAGFGLVGGAMRYRRRRTAAVFA